MFFLYALYLALIIPSAVALPYRRAHFRHVHSTRQTSNTTTPISSSNASSSGIASGNATAGCGQASPWVFDDTNHKNVTMGDRSFLVHIPASYDPNIPHAMVLSFHGFKDNDLKQEEITGFSQKGLTLNGRGIIAVYPNGQFGPGKSGNESIRAWQGAPYSPPGVDDIAFTQQMIQQLQSNLCVDANRIYASGKSNGGGFTNLLACTPSTAGIFAAFAPVSAALYSGANPQNCNPGRPVPIINFHGLADEIIPFDGQNADRQNRTEYATPNITEYREAWAIRNGCSSLNSTSTAPATGMNSTAHSSLALSAKLGINAAVSHPHPYTTLKQSDCSATSKHAVVDGFTVKKLGHSWPSTKGLDGGITDFNATTANILPFFDQHSLDD